MKRVLPNQKNRLHDWCKEINDFWKVSTGADQVMEEIRQGVEILEVFNSFISGHLDFLLKLAEWTSIGGFVLLQELEHSLYSL